MENVKKETSVGGKPKHKEKKSRKSDGDLILHNSGMNNKELAKLATIFNHFKLRIGNVAELAIGNGASVRKKSCQIRGTKKKAINPNFSYTDLGPNSTWDPDSGKDYEEKSNLPLSVKDSNVRLSQSPKLLRAVISNLVNIGDCDGIEVYEGPSTDISKGLIGKVSSCEKGVLRSY
ncbi:hypothetical protein QYF36_015390 [Acer negundo]|nr:hypothetical protein QYF36_015390 [Acer negundo]